MDYKQWNYRGLSCFNEEIIKSENDNINEYPSIKNFQQNNIYTLEIRHKLCEYLKDCYAIVATTHMRINAYTLEPTSLLAYFTDGDFIFTNLLQEYIYYDDFVLPEKWYELIRNKNFVNDHFELNHDKFISGEVNIFDNFERSFQEPSIIKQIIL